jgi:hypothetical protein
VEDLTTPLVLLKLLEYLALLVDRPGRQASGRLFFEAHHKLAPHLTAHPWQDLQSILSAFVRVFTDSTLYGAVTPGEPVAASNY